MKNLEDEMNDFKEVLDVLHMVYGAICEKENWLKGQDAEDQTGYHVDSHDPRACHFCLGGALEAATMNSPIFIRHAARRRIIDAIQKFTSASGVVAFNDDPGTTHAQVVSVLERAIIDQEVMVYRCG